MVPRTRHLAIAVTASGGGGASYPRGMGMEWERGLNLDIPRSAGLPLCAGYTCIEDMRTVSDTRFRAGMPQHHWTVCPLGMLLILLDIIDVMYIYIYIYIYIYTNVYIYIYIYIYIYDHDIILSAI